MARRILNRKDLRADAEAAERRKQEEDEVEEEEGDEDDEEDEGDEEEAEVSEEAEDDEEEEPEKPAPKKRKPAAKEPKPKAKPKPRSRAAKIIRMKVVWGVFNNSNQRVAVYEYPKRKEADDHAARLTTDKKSTHFVQAVKEPMEEKKES